MTQQEIIDWLLQGDISIKYQTYRDLLHINDIKLQNRISEEGWAKKILSLRNSNGQWGEGFYQPKWISTHYTLLDLKNLSITPNNIIIKKIIKNVLLNNKAKDGGLTLGPSTLNKSDICVNGMFLNYASYFRVEETELYELVDNIINNIMPDGGLNCMLNRSGATHSSLHTTISVLEGLFEFQKQGYKYKHTRIKNIIHNAEEFILQHQLFLSDRTGEVIRKDFIKLSYPSRWKYDILRALDYFQYSGKDWDDRMEPAIDIIKSKRRSDGRWNLQAAHPGKVHIKMEQAGKPSRWNTLRSLRVFNFYNIKT